MAAHDVTGPDATEHAAPSRDGIAIVGMACRFPGAPDLATFWSNLCEGKESITFFSKEELAEAGVPPEVLDAPEFVPASPVLDDVDHFDAAFFSYSAKEATVMDPQQRLLLELAWQAFEDAGYQPGSGAGPVGVFTGSGGVVTSYLAAFQARAPELLGATGSMQHIGNDKDFVSTRISYKLDLRGPSINVQTACSTSLVALHLACRSLLDGECEVALVGASTIRFPHKRGYLYRSEDILSPDGHCRAFDEQAQGTIFGSGVAAVLLKPVHAAIEAGDHIYAVIKATAINNDGAHKVSYTASSVPGQAAAMVEALALADASPDSIGYVECHATGTAVGDPLEVQALTRAFRTGTERTRYCGIGSVKTNIGHLEQAAGLASLIKTALALAHRKLPPTLNFQKANRKLGLESSPFYVQESLGDWHAAPGQRRRAGVNGLGLGGTNAFVVLEEAPEQAPGPARDEQADRPLHLFALSARSDAALEHNARRFREHLARTPDAALADVCFTVNASRSSFEHRLIVPARSLGELVHRLDRRESDHESAPAAKAHEALPIAFLFTGQGSQYVGMAAELYRSQPLFQELIDRCDALSRPHLPRGLSSVLFAGDADAQLIHHTGYTQVALFAVEYALASLWMSWGVRPGAVLGHSVGEIAAACVAGVLDLKDALELISHRGQLMGSLPAGGGMAAVFTAEENVAELLGGYPELSIAASNSANNVVVSGAQKALAALLEELSRRGISFKELTVSHAFHSTLMDPILDRLEAVAGGIALRAPSLPIVSNLSGEFLEQAPTARYFREHARQPVRFARGMQRLFDAGYRRFLEIGPGSGLLALGRQCITDPAARWLPSLSRQKDDWSVLGESLAQLYLQGHDIDWLSFDAPYSRRRLSLPTYPFQRKRYWINESAPLAARPGGAHPLLGQRLRSTLPQAQFEAQYSLDALPFFDDHRIFGLPVMPTTAGLELATTGGRSYFGVKDVQAVALEGLLYREALVLPEDGSRVVHCVITSETENKATFKLFSTSEDGHSPWIQHLEGQLSHAEPGDAASISLESVRERCTAQIPVERYYPAIHDLGLEYGPIFRGIRELWQGPGEALSRVQLQEAVGAGAYTVHPAFLDACLHIYPALATAYGDFTVPPAQPKRTFLPISMERFSVRQAGIREAWVHAVARATNNEESLVVDIRLYDDAGRELAAMEGLLVKRLTAESMQPSAVVDPILGSIYRRHWEERPTLAAAAPKNEVTPGRWLIFADRGGVGHALADRLRSLGEACQLVYRDSAWVENGARRPIEPSEPALFHRLMRDYFGVPGANYRNVVYLWGLDSSPTAELTLETLNQAESITVGSALLVVQALSVVNSVTGAAPRLWLVTRDAQPLESGGGSTAEPVQVMQSPLWALGSAMALRHPDLWGGMLDLEQRSDGGAVSDAAQLLPELWHSDGEDQLVLRGGKRFAQRLQRLNLAKPKRGADLFRADASYLIAGGLGAKGLRVADWMVTQGARHLTLADRRALDAASADAVRALEARGARMAIAQADLTSPEDVERLFQALDAGPTLRGVLHCAGSDHEDPLDLIDWQRFSAATAPRLKGAWLLHEHTRRRELDHFLLFSSVSTWMGSERRAPDAAGGVFLGALAQHRRALGLPATVVEWGPWELASGPGLGSDSARGVQAMKPDEALEALEHLVRERVEHAAVTQTDWPTFMQRFKGGVPPLYSLLGSGPSRQRRARSSEDPAVSLQRINKAPPAERRAIVIEVARRHVTDVLDADALVDVESPMVELGLDSLLSVNLVNRLEAALGVSVPLAKILQGGSVQGLVDVLFPALVSAAAQPAASAEGVLA
jgi:acyl transferase domain-containing protein/acyl carrier protein